MKTFLPAAIVNTERNLIEHLLRNSTREARPVLSQTYPTNVSFGAELVQLINVVISLIFKLHLTNKLTSLFVCITLISIQHAEVCLLINLSEMAKAEKY